MKIVQIDSEKCDGCGLCVGACHEGALALVAGKAALVRENLCDGLGACLPACPRNAIAMLETAVQPPRPATAHLHAHGTHAACPGSRVQQFSRAVEPVANPAAVDGPSKLTHWPVQLALVSAGASFLRGADILLCADCVPFAVPDFHARYLRDRVVLVGCPKLDDLRAYEEKLGEIFATAVPRSACVLRMEVPCCGGLAAAATRARDAAMPGLDLRVYVISIRDGREQRVA